MRVSSINKRILFVHNALQSFVRTDRDLLREKWPVIERFERKPSLRMASAIRDVMRCDLVFCWFASWHSLIPVVAARALKKPSVVVVGGYDTACLPEINYGLQTGGFKTWVARSVMMNATHLIAISENARREVLTNAKVEASKISVIYPGVQQVPMGALDGREAVFLTVGSVRRLYLWRKGLLPFVETASYFPEYRFLLVGKWYDQSIEILRAKAPSNVAFLGFISDRQLYSLYRRAYIYIQASLHEGFGISLAEAMSAGCLPVVTKAGAIPEVVGDCGIYANSNSPSDLCAALVEALQMDSSIRLKASQRISQRFNVDLHRTSLIKLISGLID